MAKDLVRFNGHYQDTEQFFHISGGVKSKKSRIPFDTNSHSFLFDGVNDFTRSAKNSNPFARNDFTVGGFFKTSSSTSQVILYNGCNYRFSISRIPFCCRLNNVGALRLSVYNWTHTTPSNPGGKVFVSNTTGFDDGQWHEWVYRYDASGNSAILMVDGVVEALTDTGGGWRPAPTYNHNRLGLGAEHNNSGGYGAFAFNGVIDHIYIYDRWLSDSEVSYNFFKGKVTDLSKGMASGALLHWWKGNNTGFDEAGNRNFALFNGASYSTDIPN